jgi:hypothetical protein
VGGSEQVEEANGRRQQVKKRSMIEEYNYSTHTRGGPIGDYDARCVFCDVRMADADEFPCPSEEIPNDH